MTAVAASASVDGAEHAVPADDIVNAIALRRCTDTRHRILFRGRAGIESLTLAELDRRAVNVARHLHGLGVRARDRIGIMAGNRIEWVLLDLAVIKLGAVTAGFEPGRFDADGAVAEYGLRLLFTDRPTGRDEVRDIGAVRGWVDGPDTPPPAHPGYDPADILAIKFTSGSTGVPKGLEATVGSVNDSIIEVQRMFAHGDGDNILVFLRLALLQQRYWIYSALVHGHDVTVADIADALPLARETSPTVVMGVPGFYEDLRARLEGSGPLAGPTERRTAIQGALGGRIRYLWTGSAPASPGVLEFFNGCGVPLFEGYGLNETCIVAKNHPAAFRLGSVGRVLPNKTVRFDRDGILIVGSRHPVNCRYTWCAPGASEQVFLPTGEVRTNDLGHVDADGFLYIHGRADDILTLSSGRNIAVRLVEERLREHPEIHECVLYGTGREYVSAVVSPAGPGPDRDRLVRFVADLNDGLLSEQRIHAVVVAAEPFTIDNGLLTSQYKPKRAEIHRRYTAVLDAVYERDNGGSPAPDRPLVISATDSDNPPGRRP
jgi:long-subunit acyl-CoA synthetase (AMP-forming)